jgi:uncharacterized protein
MTSTTKQMIGVGLRSPHYEAALNSNALVDFVEVHAENFFADGGASLAVLDQAAARFPISLHATALGLGSKSGVAPQYVQKLNRLVERINPFLVSDHAAHAWSQHNEVLHHAGDLLPLAFNDDSLNSLCENVENLQHHIKSRILVENISAYVVFSNNTMSETDFLTALTQRTGCGLLLDLNNLAVNATNSGASNPIAYVSQWIESIPLSIVGEIHLAGCAQPAEGELMIDDHSNHVSETVWQAYRLALKRFGTIPTLIEWDSNLPSWETLVAEAQIARSISQEVLAS